MISPPSGEQLQLVGQALQSVAATCLHRSGVLQRCVHTSPTRQPPGLSSSASLLLLAPLSRPCIMRSLPVFQRSGVRVVARNACAAPPFFPLVAQFQQQCALLADAASAQAAGWSCDFSNQKQQQLHQSGAHQQPRQKHWRWLSDERRFHQGLKQLQRSWKPRQQERHEQQHWRPQRLHGQQNQREKFQEREQNQRREGEHWQEKAPQEAAAKAASRKQNVQRLLGTSLRLQGREYAPDPTCSSLLFETSTVRGLHKVTRKLEQTQSKVSSFLSSFALQAAESSPSHEAASCRPGLVQLPGVHTPEQLVQLARRTVEDCARFLATGGADEKTTSARGYSTDERGQASITTPTIHASTQKKVVVAGDEAAAAPDPGPGASAAAVAEGGSGDAIAGPTSEVETSPVNEATAVGGAERHLANKEVLEEARLAVQTLDAVSNALCKVADVAELLRQVHPDDDWRSAASEVVLHVQEFMSRTNVNNRVYAQLERLAAATSAPTETADTARPTPAGTEATAGAAAVGASTPPSPSAAANPFAPADTAAASSPAKTGAVSATTSSPSSAAASSALDASNRTIRAHSVTRGSSSALSIHEPERKLAEATADRNNAGAPAAAEGDGAEGKENDVGAVLSVEERVVLRSMRDAMQQQGVFLNSDQKDAYLKLIAEEAALAASISQQMEQQHACDSAEHTLAVDPEALVEAGVPPAVVQHVLSEQSPRQRRFFFSRKARTTQRRSCAPLTIAPDSELAHSVLKYAADDGLRRDVFELNQQRQQRDTTCEEMMLQLLRLRQQRARYAGYGNWNAFAQREGILKNPQAVSAFLSRVSSALQPGVRRELEVLANLKQKFLKPQCSLSRPSPAATLVRRLGGSISSASRTFSADKEHQGQLLQPWDVSFFMHQYALLNPCNPGDRMLSLAFIFSKLQELVSRTMGLQLVRTPTAKGETWHWSVLRFDLHEPATQRAFRLSPSRRHSNNESDCSGSTSSNSIGDGSTSEGSSKHASPCASASAYHTEEMPSTSATSAASCSAWEPRFSSGAPSPPVSRQSAATSCRGVLYVDLWSRPNKPRLLAQFTLRGSKCFSFAHARGWSLGGPLWLSSVENLSDTLFLPSPSVSPSYTGRKDNEKSGSGLSSCSSCGSHLPRESESITKNSHVGSDKPTTGGWSHETRTSSSGGWPLLRQVPCTALICSFSPPPDAAGVLTSSTERVASAERDVERLLRETRLPLAQARTLLHEFGHAVHSLVSETALQHLSGTRGPVDFSEFPSILFEHFTSPLFVPDTDGDQARGAQPARGSPTHKQPRCSFAHLQAAQMLLHALLDQGFYSYVPRELSLAEAASSRTSKVESDVVTTGLSPASASVGSAVTAASPPTACARENSFENNCSQNMQRLHAWLDMHYKKHEWLTTPMEALTSESVGKTLGMPRVSRFEHLVHYGGTYFSYLLCRAMASFVWQHAFAADPFSREAGQRLCAVLGRGSVDCSMRPVLDVAGPSLTACERLQLLQSPALLPLTPFLHELTVEITASASLLIF